MTHLEMAKQLLAKHKLTATERQIIMDAWHEYAAARKAYWELANNETMIRLNGAWARVQHFIWKYEDRT